ncbi:MAG: hypothetical protein NC082_06250 [Clostridiales bacterium]|nr:hypothetical protein [Clostridiales bacterium]
MSHSFDCVVDTTELAQSVHAVNSHVNGTTAAVVAMKAAVIKAEQDGADHVCKKVNQGFYSMIHSQISQKMAAMQSRVDAQLMRLNQQHKQLSNIRRRMERDYQMICARYGKLFTAINRNLRQRVTELDRPIIDLATTEADKVSNRASHMTATIPLGQTESVKTSQHLLTSNLKYRASHAIEAIERFISGYNRLQYMIDRVLLSRRSSTETSQLNVPVIMMESNYDRSDNKHFQVTVSKIDMTATSRNLIENRLSVANSEQELSWQANGTIDPQLSNQFHRLVASSDLDQRRRDTIVKLFEANNFLTL